MKKATRILASSFGFMAAAMLIGYGFAGIDFAFGDDRWSRSGDRTSIFPLVGKISTVDAFTLGMTTAAIGFFMLLVSSFIFIANYSTVRRIPGILAGVLLISWGIWGIAFAWNTIEFRITHGIDRVEIPCFGYCSFTSQDWLLINFVMITGGFAAIFVSHARSRYVTLNSAG